LNSANLAYATSVVVASLCNTKESTTVTNAKDTAILRELRRLRENIEDQALQIATLERAAAPQVRINREILGTLQRAPGAFNGHRAATK
jgi:hypothetical protein